MNDKKQLSEKAARRQAAQKRKRKQQVLAGLLWGGIGLGLLALIGYLIWNSSRPPVGVEVAIPEGYETHVQEGTPPGPYPTDPPAGGVHYPSELEAGFYQESDLPGLGQYPEGALVHNLEHGYVIFWYNCDGLDEAGCSQLKADIQKVMDGFRGVKLIAFPWKTIDVPLVMTSWGRLQSFQAFDADLARDFVRANRNHAPEPNAP